MPLISKLEPVAEHMLVLLMAELCLSDNLLQTSVAIRVIEYPESIKASTW